MSRLVLTLGLLALSAIGAQAQSYPTRAVTVVVPFAAGGPADITGRIVADIFSRAARPAVRGRECRRRRRHHRHDPRRARRCRRLHPRSPATSAPHAAARRSIPNLAYDPDNDFEPIGLDRRAAGAPHGPQGISPPTTCKEFVAYAKANESKLNMGHAGVGSVSYIGCLLLNSAIGIKPTLVPFTGTAPVINAMLRRPGRLRLRPGARPAAACARRHAKAMAIATKKRQPAAAGRADLGRSRACRSSTCRAVLCGVRAQGHAAGRRRQARGRARQGPRRGGRPQAPGRPRRRDRRAEADRGPKALAALVKSEIARLTPILKAAAAK